MLAALAGVTRTIRLGTMVLVLPLRNPVYFAKEWATLDLLSGGRTILGLGVGWHEDEFALMGVPYRERGPRTSEAIEVLEGAVGGRRRHLRGQVLPVPRPDHRSQARAAAAPADLDRRRYPALGEGLRPDGAGHHARAEAGSRSTPTPGCRIPRRRPRWSRATGPRCRPSRAKPAAIRLASVASTPTSYGYSSRASVRSRRRRTSRSTPAWTSTTGRPTTCSATAEEVAARISARIAALDGGVDQIVLNPLDWGLEQLELIAGAGAAAREGLTIAAPIRYTGQRIKRLEDPRLLRGRGRYLDDIVLPRMLALAFVRCPHATPTSARSTRRPPRALPGVAAVLTASDLDVEPLAPGLMGQGFVPTAWPALATAGCAVRRAGGGHGGGGERVDRRRCSRARPGGVRAPDGGGLPRRRAGRRSASRAAHGEPRRRRRGVRRRAADLHRDVHPRPLRRGADGAARRDRRLGRRQPHRVGVDPDAVAFSAPRWPAPSASRSPACGSSSPTSAAASA